MSTLSSANFQDTAAAADIPPFVVPIQKQQPDVVGMEQVGAAGAEHEHARC